MTSDYVMTPTVTLAAGQRVIATALEKAQELAVDVCIAVTDSAGHLLTMARMDRAPLLSIQIAHDKAYSVSSFSGLPTSEWWRILESESALLHGIVKTDRLIVFGGGCPWWPTGAPSGRSASPADPANRTSRSRRQAPPRSAERRRRRQQAAARRYDRPRPAGPAHDRNRRGGWS